MLGIGSPSADQLRAQRTMGQEFVSLMFVVAVCQFVPFRIVDRTAKSAQQGGELSNVAFDTTGLTTMIEHPEGRWEKGWVCMMQGLPRHCHVRGG
eukprot:2079131-Amphidinium_carterae.1